MITLCNTDQNGLPPYDGSPVEVIDPTPIGLTVVLYLLGTVGIAAAVAALVFNITYRKKRFDIIKNI